MVDPLAAADPLQDGGFLAVSIRRDDSQDRLPDHLLGRVAEDPLRRLVPAGDDPIGVLADDGVVRRLHDRRQQRRLRRGALLAGYGFPLAPGCSGLLLARPPARTLPE